MKPKTAAAISILCLATLAASATAAPPPGKGYKKQAACSYDVDGSGYVEWWADGIIIAKYLEGWTNLAPAWANNLATRTDSTELAAYLGACRPMLDVDADAFLTFNDAAGSDFSPGGVGGKGDAMILLGCMWGFEDYQLAGLASDNCTRCTAEELVEFVTRYGCYE